MQENLIPVVCLDWPYNWTGHPSLVQETLPGAKDSLLNECFRSLHDYPAGFLCLRSDNSEALSEILGSCPLQIVRFPAKTSELRMFHEVSQRVAGDTLLLKVLPEDFLRDNRRSSVQGLISDHDYIFTIHHHTGLNYELIRAAALQRMAKINPDSGLALRNLFAFQHYSHFRVRRIMVREVFKEGDLLRLTLDRKDRLDRLRELFPDGLPEQAEIFSSLATDPLFVQTLPPPFFDHRARMQSVMSEAGHVQFMERGLMFKHLIPAQGLHLDICAGSLTLPEYVYSQAAREVVCLEEGEHARKIHSERGLAGKNIRLVQGSVLDSASWEDIANIGPFDSMSFTAAIEHFTEEEQNFILAQAAKVLKPDAYLFGDTNLFQKDGMLACWQHRREFFCPSELRGLFENHFEDVEIITSFYRDLTLQPVYFKVRRGKACVH